MSNETIIKAEKSHCIHFLTDCKQFTMEVPILAWAVPSEGRPIPITAQGRFDKNTPHMIYDGSSWLAVPDGESFHLRDDRSFALEVLRRTHV